ncbi:protein CMS1-like [Vicia villosa]|uniref:protein CMS1-like n=1 Tax=Vicia villosa TaxID=3911 RepID=UPI00273CA047|nr:protein CMS1-like [Vicia villosa]XP_058771970.1 protein CMS1-like [Vicia villosa]
MASGKKGKRKGSDENDDDRTQKKNKTTETNEEPLRFFVNQFQAANGVHLSSIELESLKDTTILELSNSQSTDTDLDVKFMAGDVKASFGDSWRKVLCESELVEGKIAAGSPSVLVVSYSALRSIHLLKGFRSVTKLCSPVKLFSKHIKLQEQISLLKNRVNIASGTPSRIKKLIDIEALGLSRLKVLVLDIHPDVKGFSLFTLPQVRDEFWDLFKNYFYQPMIQGDLRICLYGPCKPAAGLKSKKGPPVRDE